jgi:hypothetical protein
VKTNTNHKAPQGVLGRLRQSVGWILRKECQFLIRKGLSTSFAKKLTVVINLFILISLLFILFPMWMGLVTLIIGALLLAGVDIDVSPPPQEEWRMGPSGWGLYKGDECIIWKDDPDDLND